MPSSSIKSLKGRNIFKKISQEDNSIVTKQFVYLHSKSEKKPPCLGIIATRKIGNAVTRNRIRRRVRECFRDFFSRINPDTDSNFVVVLRKRATSSNFKDIKNDIDKVLKKILKIEA